MEKQEIKTTAEEIQPKIIIPATSVLQKKRICEVCGYANPEYTAQCKKCSNYL